MLNAAAIRCRPSAACCTLRRAATTRAVPDPPSACALRQEALSARIRAIHTASRATYGAPRVHAELIAQGERCCLNTAAKLMRRAGIVPKTVRRFRVTTNSRHTQAAPNLLGRVFSAERPNACWLTDITFIPTREGWLYLAVILDLYSRAVLGAEKAEALSPPAPLRYV
jgi:putative transposase